jgi:biopolymer transport protein ExbB
MADPLLHRSTPRRWLAWVLLLVVAAGVLQARSALSQPPAETTATEPGRSDAAATAELRPNEDLNLFRLIWDSGWWMLPIGLMSFLAVAVSIERAIGLSRARVIPEPLVTEMARLGGERDGFDPREAYRLCQRYPSAAANVIRTMLLKVGRPHTEVEHTVKEASDREAQRLYGNVRWLNLAAGVSPLIGLMGTVWGMILAFHRTAAMMPGQNKSDSLAEGIYLALVTTLGGLAVAIPATIMSHYFEGRIVSLFHQIDELLFHLMPQVEKYEGRVRFSRTEENGSDEPGIAAPAPAVASTTRSATSRK